MLLYERRACKRETLQLHLRLADGSTARTRNVCEKGLYVVLPHGVRIDDWISLELTLPSGRLHVCAFGEVLRTEQMDDGTGIAMRLHGTQLSRWADHAA